MPTTAPKKTDRLLTLEEVRDRLNLTPADLRHVRALIDPERYGKLGPPQLQAINIGAGKYKVWRVYESELQRFLRSRRNDA